MSTKEIAYTIFEKLSEEQLKGFIAMFKEYYPAVDEQKDQQLQSDAFIRLNSMIRPGTHSITDDKKELEEYRREKYGI